MLFFCVCFKLFQVPKEKKCVSSGVKPTDLSVHGPDNCGSLEMLDHHLQALRSMPVNLSLNNSSITEHQASKYRGECKGGAPAAFSLVKTEIQTSMPHSRPGGPHREEAREHLRMVYEQNRYDLSLAGYLKDEQRSSPDSMCDDGVEVEVRLAFHFFFIFIYSLGGSLS